MSFHLSKTSKERMSGCDARLKMVVERAINITLMYFGIPEHGGLRTAEEQNKLYRDGSSEADGYRNISKHQAIEPNGKGRAVDVYAYIDGAASWEREHLAVVAAAMLQAASELGVKIKWGGLWKTKKHPFYGWDMPHFQLDED